MEDRFKSYDDRTKSRLDKFFYKIASLKKYPVLEKVMKMISLNHGQANIERGSCVNENLLKDNMKEASLISWRVIYYHIAVKTLSLKLCS